ncbi:sigma-70 family RNA polymerase sigma factor [Streptacidiphilus monticola]|uniref:Sigma-70 family RNA polymerase sigma factor n=1 Tax=Streptacidiphilus monticola TaxID=2161674 RepID=A0ABW1FZ77_9ACTN
MSEAAVLTSRFEEHRPHLRAVAYRLLGSLSEAEDAVQEAWLRLERSDTAEVGNLGGWLTTVVSRICLNMLRSRAHRREEPLDVPALGATASDAAPGPEEEAVLADSVGVALLVVLDRLSPAERVAFVLHDLFAVPFEEVGAVMDRSPAAVRQLASRARRRVRGGEPAAGGDPARQRQVVSAFLAATRSGDLAGLLSLLHPDVVLHADRMVVPTPEPVLVRGAQPVAQGAMAATGRARWTGLALVNGSTGLVMAPQGRLRVVLTFTFGPDGITAIDVIADERLAALRIAALPD